MDNQKNYKKYDTHAETTYMVKLAMDARVFERGDKGDDVVLTFCDNSRIEGTLEMWVDARVQRYFSDRARQLKKGDEVLITGKLRFKATNDGGVRGKIYDARIASFVPFQKDWALGANGNGAAEGDDPIPSAFE